MTERKITWSYGGGTQSIAIALLIAQGRLPKPKYIGMMDTSREKSQTFEYHEKYMKPIFEEIGTPLDIIPHTYAHVDVYNIKGTLLLPAYTKTGQARNFCSFEWKKYALKRKMRELGYGPKNPVITWMGISVDEFHRMKPSGVKWQEYAWPLIYNVHFTREDCKNLILDFGFPDPPKSSCWMCPYMSLQETLEMRENHPQDFEKAIQFEKEMQTKEDSYLVSPGVSFVDLKDIPSEHFIDDAMKLRRERLAENKAEKFNDDICDSGLCFV